MKRKQPLLGFPGFICSYTKMITTEDNKKTGKYHAKFETIKRKSSNELCFKI